MSINNPLGQPLGWPIGSVPGAVPVPGPSLTDWRCGEVEAAKTRTWIPYVGGVSDGFR